MRCNKKEKTVCFHLFASKKQHIVQLTWFSHLILGCADTHSAPFTDCAIPINRQQIIMAHFLIIKCELQTFSIRRPDFSITSYLFCEKKRFSIIQCAFCIALRTFHTKMQVLGVHLALNCESLQLVRTMMMMMMSSLFLSSF